MNPARHRTVVVVLIALLTVGGWAADLNAPLGIAGWIWYCIPLLLSFYAGGGFSPFLLAAGFSVLTLAGFYLSPPGIDPGLAFISRMTGICVFWVMACLIRQRKRTEAALHESEERCRNVVETARDAIFTVSREGRLTSANSACEAIAGWKHDELIGRPFATLVHPDDLALATQMFQRALAGEKTPGTELRARTRSGQFLALEFLSTRQVENGRVIGILSIGRDVTARKQAEEATRRQNEYLTALQETMLDVAAQLDLNRLLENILKRAGQLMGTTTGFLDLLEPGDDHLTPKIALGVLAEESLKYKNKPDEGLGGKVWQTGQTILVEDYDAWPERIETHQKSLIRSIMAVPLMSKSGFVGVLGLAHERNSDRNFGPEAIRQLNQFAQFATIAIENARLYSMVQCELTQRKEAEAALRESEERYRQLFDLAADAVILVDSETHRYVDVNKAAQRLYGYTREEFLQMRPEDVSAEPDKTRHHIVAADAHVPLLWHRKKNGERFAVEINANQIIFRGRRTALVALRDVTARQRAEEQLRQLSGAVEHSPVSIVITDPAGNIEYVNPKFTEVSGYSLKEVIGKNPRILKSGETPVKEYQRMWQTITSGREWRGEFHNRRKNGGLFWESASISSILDDSGKIARFVAVKEDITEVKQAREKLRQRESFLSAITENQPGLIWLKDAESRFLTVNKTFAAACGRSHPEHVHGLTDLDIWPKELAEKYRRDDQRVMATGKACMVEEMIFIENTHVWHETFKTPVRDDQGRVIGTTGYARDITERKRAEEQLREAFNFNRKIISDAAVGIVVFKASGQCVLANETAAQALGATVPRILEQNFRHIASWRDSEMLQIAEQSLAAKEPRQCEAHFVTTFGKEVWLVCHFSHFVQNGEAHLLLIFNDVTEKKKLEAQFLRSQRMESIGTLAGGIAHDLNNVLTPLLFSVQILKENIPDADGQNTLKILEANVVRGANLVKQLLTFGRGIQGERIMVQPKHIGQNIRQIVHATFPKSVEFEFHSTADLWSVTGDPTQIEQVLLNLCVNARDAMPGGGKLSIHMGNKTLGEADTAMYLDAKPGHHVVISVTDTGNGMTKEIQDRMFEPFFTTKELGKGTGLGLSTTLAIVKSHGGFINCYSEPGKGSVFKVYLPANPDTEAVEKTAADKSSLLRGHNQLVLVVDDEEPIRKLAQTMLEHFGYRVLLAVNGEEAVQLYTSRQNEIAVVITDMSMPVMDGHATITALQAINPKVKVIGSSGLDMNDGSARAINPAIRHFIPKPYTVESMLNILHEVLQENPVK